MVMCGVTAQAPSAPHLKPENTAFLHHQPANGNLELSDLKMFSLTSCEDWQKIDTGQKDNLWNEVTTQ